MSFTKVTASNGSEYTPESVFTENGEVLGVIGQDKTPGLSVKEMQESIEAVVRKVAIPAHNALVDELSAETAAEDLGAVDKNGNPSNVQERIDSAVENDGTMPFVRLNADRVIETSTDGLNYEATGSSGHIIEDRDGVIMPQRSRLRFEGGTVEDRDGVTVVTAMQGEQGEQGERGERGEKGEQGNVGPAGPVMTPSISAAGVLSWELQETAIPPSPVSIRGPQGPQGVAGVQGVQGERGPAGVQGIAGPQGVAGKQGETGPAGPTGPQGATGPAGPTGPQGPKGNTGDAGPAGSQGAIGPAGPQGPMGPQGPAGADGKDGLSLYVEDIYETLAKLEAAFPVGNDKMYMVEENGECYIWSERNGAWTSVGKLQGATGPQGPAGATGVQGPAGTIEIGSVTTGEAGTSASVENVGTAQAAVLNIVIPRGNAGAQGPTGPTGPTGPQGPAGETGPQGPQGIQGQTGEQGAIGPEGPQGPAGPAGADGKSAFQSAADAGYSGTETDFNEALARVPNMGDMRAATYDPTGKQQDVFAYADTAAGNAVTGYLPLAGGNMTGPINANSTQEALILASRGGYIKGYNQSGGKVTVFGASPTKVQAGHPDASLYFYGDKATRPKYNGINMALQSDIPAQKKVVSIMLSSSWSGDGPYTQVVTVTGATANSKVDLQPDATILSQLAADGVTALYIVNDGGVFTAYAVGAVPTAVISMQATVEEVTV